MIRGTIVLLFAIVAVLGTTALADRCYDQESTRRCNSRMDWFGWEEYCQPAWDICQPSYCACKPAESRCKDGPADDAQNMPRFGKQDTCFHRSHRGDCPYSCGPEDAQNMPRFGKQDTCFHRNNAEDCPYSCGPEDAQNMPRFGKKDTCFHRNNAEDCPYSCEQCNEKTGFRPGC